MKKKIVLSILSVFILFIGIFGQVSFGLGIEHFAKAEVNGTGDVSPDFVYRTYTTAHPQTVSDWPYAGNKQTLPDSSFQSNPPEWSYDETPGTPSTSSFVTNKLKFHKERIGIYDWNGYGEQYSYTSGLVTNPSVLAINPSGIHTWEITASLLGSNASLETGSNIVLETPSQSFRMTLLASGTGAGYVNGYKPYVNASNPTGADSVKVYVTDHRIYQDQLEILKSNLVANKIFVSNETETLYASNMGPIPAVGKDANGFSFHKSAKSLIDSKWWGTGSEKGQNTEDQYRLGSVINLYDNTIEFPQIAKRTVIVRHLDIGDNSVISSAIVNSAGMFDGNATATLINADGTTKTASGINGIVTSNRTGYIESEVYVDRNDGTKNYVASDDGIKIELLQKLDYEVLGYNTACSTDLNVATTQRNTKISNNFFDTLPVGSTSVSVLPNTSKVDDYVLVDVYYKKRAKPPRTILVRYIDIGSNTTISTNIVNAAPSLTNLVTRTTATAPITSQKSLYPEYQEVWVIPEDETMTIKAPTALTGYTYRGYIAAGSSSAVYKDAFDQSITGRAAEIAKNAYTATSTDKVLVPRTADQKYKYVFGMIDFYYSRNSPPPPTEIPVAKLQLQPLLGTIRYAQASGSPFSLGAANRAIVPSNESIMVGNSGAYKYMLGGIEVRKIEITQDKTYTIDHNITRSGQFKYSRYTCPVHTSGAISDSSSTTCSVKIIDKAAVAPSGTPPTGGSAEVSHICNKTFTLNTSVTAIDTATTKYANKTWTYKVPVKYTYYIVPNLRVFKIDRLEIYNTNGTVDSTGLPLLYKGTNARDNIDYTLYPTSTYNTDVKTQVTNPTGYTSDVRSGDPNTSDGAVWTDLYDWGTNNLWSSKDKTTAKSSADSQLLSDATLQMNDQSNRSVAEQLNSKVTFNVKNTDIKIDGRTMVDGLDVPTKKNITRVIELKNFDSSGFNYGGYTPPTGDSYATIAVSQTTYPYIKTYLDYATAYPNVNNVAGSTDKISSHYYPSFSKTDIGSWSDNVFKIPMSRLNGDRLLTAKMYYTIDSRNTISTDGDSFTDTEWQYVSTIDNISANTLVDGPKTGAFIDRFRMYKDAGIADGNVQLANVFTPIAVTGEVSTPGSLYVDHTSSGTLGSNVIQKNAIFKVVCLPSSSTNYGGLTNSKIFEYIKTYYVKLNFDVQNVRIKDVLYKSGGIVTAGTWIGPINKTGIYSTKENYITAQSVESPDIASANAAFNAEEHIINVMAIANNVPTSPSNLASDIARKIVTESDFTSTVQNSVLVSNGFNNSVDSISYAFRMKYHGRNDIKNISNYAAISSDITTNNLSRIFDFKVTDVKDVDWKNVFRKTENNNLSVHTGNVYYSGNTKWDFYSLNLNEILTRTSSEIGTAPKRTLPIGPYKNTNTGYTKAPKMGYRFSFDLKTTGKVASTTNRTVEIIPSFYYISKDATKLLINTASNNKIKFFYKNSVGKYVEIGTNNVNTYGISFVPKDGYRYSDKNLYAYNNSNMLSTNVTIGNLNKLTLTKDMMALSNNGFVQTWYGEYKLPNSTIAVEVDASGKYDINKPLKDGYIGVIFDIVATVKEDQSIKLEYNQINKQGGLPNTSQWDYEGYMGFLKQGNNLTSGEVGLKLEKGTWYLDNATYNLIKGTVILYDTDSRAASDFE